MKARNLAILVVAMLVVGFSIIGLLVRHDRKERARLAHEREVAASTSHANGMGNSFDAGAGSPGSRIQRDELRRKILEAWSQGEKGPEVAADAKQGRFEEHPDADGWGIEPSYIQAAFVQQMMPMARVCYEDLLARHPDAGGKLELWFKIVADEKLGGVVEEDDDPDAGPFLRGWTGDAKMQTCMRESMMTVTFPPPAKGGVVTVGYPVVFEAGDDDDSGTP